MEIYQAINEYRDIEDLGIEGINPWHVRPDDRGDGYIVTRKYSPALNEYYAVRDMGLMEMFYIGLKRGGIRRFKTLDAACNTVREIGQEKVEVIL